MERSMVGLGAKALRAGTTLPPLAPGQLRLYANRFCPFVKRVHLVLKHKGIRYETVNVNLFDKPEWFFEKNSDGLVPVLEQDDKVIQESLTICEYLDEVYPEKKLISSDPYTKAKDSIFIQRFTKVTSRFYQVEKGNMEWPEVLRHLLPIEKALKADFFAGDNPGYPDLMIWPWFEMDRMPLNSKTYAEDGLVFPKLQAWRERMLAMPAVKETAFDSKTHADFFALYVKRDSNCFDVGL